MASGARAIGFLSFAFAATALGAGAPAKVPSGGKKINGVVYSEKGNAVSPSAGREVLPPEQALRLKKIFLFPSMDDLSGALAPKLDEKLADLFNHNTRFEVVRDPQVLKALSPDESSYYKAALSQEVHKEAAKVTGADTTVLLRTRNVGPDTRMTLELRDGSGSLLFSEEGTVPGSAKMEDRWVLIEKLYRSVLSKLPFEGTVTGRTAATLTVDLGIGSMRTNEEIEIARIVSVQRHPLLGTVVGTDYVRTGRARVTSVDKVLSFAEVIEEFPGEKVSPGQKILRSQAALVHRPSGPQEQKELKERKGKPAPDLERREQPGADESQKEEAPLDDRLKGGFDRPKPRYGNIGGNLHYGSLTHSQTVDGNTSDYSGSGIGGLLDGELWVTKNWILSAGYGFHSVTLSGSSGSAGSTGWSSMSVLGGFRIFPEGVGEGLIVTGSLGYQSMRYAVPANGPLLLSEKKYSGILLRVEGEIAFLEGQKIAGGFSIQPFGSFTDVGNVLGVANNATVIGVHISWNRLLLDQIWLKIGARYDVANGNYEGSSNTASDKHFALGPGIYYLF